MKWIIFAFIVLFAWCLLLYGQSAHYGPPASLYKEVLTGTFGTGKTADTLTVSAGTATDKYILTPTAEPNGMLYVTAGTGKAIITSTATETTLTYNAVRFR